MEEVDKVVLICVFCALCDEHRTYGELASLEHLGSEG